MSDRALRSSERALQADPNDQDALHYAIAVRQRAGLPVPGWMHARCLSAPRRFDSASSLDVSVLLPDGRQRGVGRTPSQDPEGLELPEHRTFWVRPPAPTDASLEALVDELAAEGVPGLALGPDLSDAGLAHLVRLADRLTWLDLGACGRITRAGLRHLRRLESLATLNLWYCTKLDESGLAEVAGVSGLSTLDLGNCTGIRQEGLEPLAALKELAALSLGSCTQVGDAGLALLARLPHLTSLDLRRCAQITDAGVKALAGAEELTVLNLSSCTELTAKGLGALASLPRLSQLCLVGCGLREDRVRAALAPLADQCEISL